jgi:hypothetical protein
MSASAFVFLVISALVVLAGLVVIAVGEGYMYAWGFMLTAFGLFFGYGIVKRHFDAVDAARH